ncbi:hypothetical protein ACQY0O_004251 [Thecaphora frezii]
MHESLLAHFDITLGLDQSTSTADAPPLDPKQARLQAAFQRARSNYSVKLEDEAWFLPSSSTLRDAAGYVDVARFRVPTPTELRRARVENKRQSLDQEWTIDYLYSIGRFDLGLAYAISFFYSMDLPLRLDLDDPTPLDAFPRPRTDSVPASAVPPSAQSAQTKLVKKSSTDVKGPTKELLDAGLRCVMGLAKQNAKLASLSDTSRFAADLELTTWTAAASSSPSSASAAAYDPDADQYVFAPHPVRRLALALLAVGYVEVRRGAGDHLGFKDLVRPCPDTGRLVVNPNRLKAQNWTICSGMALSMGQLCVEMGLYRMAVESLTLFLASRGAHWRGLLPCALALHRLTIAAQREAGEADEALEELVKALVVCALQSAPKRRRHEMARLVVDGKILSPELVDRILVSPAQVPLEASEVQQRDVQLLDTLLRYAVPAVLAEETVVALCAVVCHRKGGIAHLAYKIKSYLENCAKDAEAQDAEEEDAVQQPRSVRTL